MDKIKQCHMCGEEILSVAKKCKHCGEYLDVHSDPVEESSKKRKNIIAGTI